jgi:hypothetical protein
MPPQKDDDQFSWSTPVIVAMIVGSVFMAAGILWVLSNIGRWNWLWGFSEPSIVLFILMGALLLVSPLLSSFTLPGGIGVVFRNLHKEVQEVRNNQLVGEVVFDNDQKTSRELFWIDEVHRRRRLPNRDTASLFMTSKGAIGVPKATLDNLTPGPDIAAISETSFRLVDNHLFVILDNNKISYLPSWSLPIKYGHRGDVKPPQIDPTEFQKYEIFR